MKLIIFYDSHCPLCVAEMRELKKYDKDSEISLEDLNATDFIQRYPYIDRIEAMKVLHAQLDSGEILRGLDVTHRAWSTVGKHSWLAVLRWPVLRIVADFAYRLFARHRYRISYWLTGKSRCQKCQLDDLTDKP